MKMADRKFAKSVENTGGKGEIACYEQFLLFSLCFQQTYIAYMYKQGLVLERVNYLFQQLRATFSPFPIMFLSFER